MKRVSVWSLMALLTPLTVSAETFKCIGTDGRVTYSEKKEANAQCTPVTTQINVMPAPPRSAPPPKSSESKSNESSGDREAKSEIAKQIAEQERALAEAKKALIDQENIRLGSEQNYQRVLDRLKPFQDKIAEIEKKLAQLREEQAKGK